MIKDGAILAAYVLAGLIVQIIYAVAYSRGYRACGDETAKPHENFLLILLFWPLVVLLFILDWRERKQ